MLPPSYTDVDQLLAELDNDQENGKWNGWLYTQDITMRDFRARFTMTYVTIDKNYIQYWKKPTDALPLRTFKTAHLKWLCQDSLVPCNPTEYIKAHENKLSFDAKQNLLKTVLNLIS